MRAVNKVGLVWKSYHGVPCSIGCRPSSMNQAQSGGQGMCDLEAQRMRKYLWIAEVLGQRTFSVLRRKRRVRKEKQNP